MAIELPHAVVKLLDFLGVTWPEVNEDKVRELADHVRDFAAKVDDSHQDATATLKRLGQGYEGASYDAMIAKWATMSSSHMDELQTACGTVATALDGAATAITTLKGSALAEIGVQAALFVADQAAAAVTFGLSELALPGIEAAGRAIMKKLIKEIEDHLVSQVVEAAIAPLEDTVAKAVSGLVYQEVSAAVGSSGGGGGAGSGFRIEPDVMRNASATMREHADTVAAHAQNFSTVVSGMSFE
jgi:uncharacterized protein YukE